jgi:protein-serine/threonine kinase
LKGSAITAEDAAKNPQAVLDVLEFYTEQTKREAEEYGESNLRGAVERMSGDKWAALVREAKSSPSTPIPTPHRPAPTPPGASNSSGSTTSPKRPDREMNEIMDDLTLNQRPAVPKLTPPKSPNTSDRMPPSPVSEKKIKS